MNLLLLSNSTNPGKPYLSWPMDYIDRMLGEEREALFIPYAAVGFTYETYEQKVNDALQTIGVTVKSIHHYDNPIEAVNRSKVIMVGGGNTFHLIHELSRLNLMPPIQNAVKKGTIYVGWSAGSNAACPSIKTTNDMPIIEPKSFDGLGLVNFQINPHYTERTIPGHGGESRLQRLKEYSAINDIPVVCLPEACGIRIDEDGTRLLSAEPVKLLCAGGEIKTLHHGMINIEC